MDRISKEARKRNMSRVRNRDTDIEIQLRKLLWENNLRYRKHYKVIGKPDIAFPGNKIAIFCDGDFWHGKNFARDGKKYNDFWYEKILINIKRDRDVTKTLEKKGWKVLRFWKEEIKKEPNKCLVAVINAVTEKTNEKLLRKEVI
jgi:DNA mismatch endonuclease (patch repair protein)